MGLLGRRSRDLLRVGEKFFGFHWKSPRRRNGNRGAAMLHLGAYCQTFRFATLQLAEEASKHGLDFPSRLPILNGRIGLERDQ